MKLRTAVVLFPAGKAFPSNYVGKPSRQSVKLQATDQLKEAFSVWFPEEQLDYCALRKGDVVQFVEDGSKYQVCFPDSQTPAPTPVSPPVATRVTRPPTSQGSAADAAPVATPAILSNQSQPDSGDPLMSDAERARLFALLCVKAKILRTCHVQMQTLFTSDQHELIVSESTIQKYAIALFADLRSHW